VNSSHIVGRGAKHTVGGSCLVRDLICTCLLTGLLGGCPDEKPPCRNGVDCGWTASSVDSTTTWVCALRPGGTVWCLNQNYRLENHSDLTGVNGLSSGATHHCARREDGTAWCWGDNSQGQLRDGTTTSRRQPTQVTGLTGVRQVAVGGYRSHALLDDGTVWRWGISFGPQPAPQTEVADASAIDAAHHACIIKNDQTLWCWGYNSCGQLGNGTVDPDGELGSDTPTAVLGLSEVASVSTSLLSTCAATVAGEAYCWGSDLLSSERHSSPIQVPGLTEVRSVRVGENNACAIRRNGEAFCWGMGIWGVIGNGTVTDSAEPSQVAKLLNVTHLAFGNSFVTAITADGTLWGWGSLQENNWRPLHAAEGDEGIERDMGYYFATVPFPFSDPE
jgi:alpha-tubulin suppressor-like RCC1 family protein